MSINEMERKARELRELQALIEEAAAEAEALKDAIKAAMGDAEEVHAGEYKITWKAVYLIMVVMRRTDVKTAPGEDSWRSCFT